MTTDEYIMEIEENIEAMKQLRRELLHMSMDPYLSDQQEDKIEALYVQCAALVECWQRRLEGDALH